MVATLARGEPIEEINGFIIRLNPNPDVAHLEDDKVYQIVTKDGQVLASGNKNTIYKLVQNDAWLAHAQEL